MPPSTPSGTSSCSGTTIPVNDFDRERLFLGPLRGRDPGLAEGRLAGIVANGMLQAVPSKLALATVADWARDPAAYEPLGSFERALRAHGAEVVEALARARHARAGRRARGRSPRSSTRSPRASTPPRLSRSSRRFGDRRRRLRGDRRGSDGGRGARAAGADVVLVDPGAHVGGMVSGGLSWTDVGDARAIGGLARRFYAGVAEHYGAALWDVKGPEPHVAERLLAGDARRRRRAPRNEGGSGRCRLCRRELRGRPDGAARRAVRGRPRVARPLRRDVGGTATRDPAGKHNFGVLLSPFAGDGSLLPFVREPELDERGWPAERPGEGDGGLQAYGFRVCLTDRAENRLPLDAPPGYDPERFELLRRYLHAAPGLEARDLLGLVPDLLPNGKCDVNSIGPFSLNLLDGSNRGYPDGSPGERAAIRDRHLAYTQGLLHFLAHDDDVPARIREEVRALGAVRRRVRRHGRLAAPAVRPRRPADARRLRATRVRPARRDAAARCCRARLLQHRHPRGRAHVALPARVRADARGLQRGLSLGRRPAVPDPVPLARAAP